MKSLLETTLTGVLALCAVVITGLLVRREFFPPTAPERKPIYLEDWRTYTSAGEQIGPIDAPLQLIEFGDYQCPFCSEFHQEFTSLRKRHPTQVALTYIHYPLPSHQFAESAARAAECAGAQDHFEAMHDQLFEQQSQLGIKPLGTLARESGVPDLSAFDVCINSEEPVARIEKGKKLAQDVNVLGTPTLIVNGWMLERTPNAVELESMLKAVLADESPVLSKSSAGGQTADTE